MSKYPNKFKMKINKLYICFIFDKLAFEVFICPKSNVSDIKDYKQIFTDIISNRAKGK